MASVFVPSVGRRLIIWGGLTLGLLALAFGLGAGDASASAVSNITVSVSATTAGQPSTYTVRFKATTALASGVGTVTLSADGGTGTIFPSGAGQYVVTDQKSGASATASTVSVSGGVSATTVTVPVVVAAGDTVKVVVTGVGNPALASTTQTLSVTTSSDTTAAQSPAYTITASADGSGSATLNQSAVTAYTPTSHRDLRCGCWRSQRRDSCRSYSGWMDSAYDDCWSGWICNRQHRFGERSWSGYFGFGGDLAVRWNSLYYLRLWRRTQPGHNNIHGRNADVRDE